MLNPQTQVDITLCDGGIQSESLGWIVVEYDDGLLKVKKGQEGDREVRIFNMRSSGFLSVDWLEYE